MPEKKLKPVWSEFWPFGENWLQYGLEKAKEPVYLSSRPHHEVEVWVDIGDKRKDGEKTATYSVYIDQEDLKDIQPDDMDAYHIALNKIRRMQGLSEFVTSEKVSREFNGKIKKLQEIKSLGESERTWLRRLDRGGKRRKGGGRRVSRGPVNIESLGEF